MGCISFTINGGCYSVGSEVSSDVTLLDYLREYLELRGTKYMCRQAGCGACVVAAAKPGEGLRAVNSCMVSITSCQGWAIQTIEGIGNRGKGYNVVQTTLAKHNGSQCGYCSPGWVMAMYCLLQSKKDLTMLEIEKSFGSNVCRCTGYRPILEAFKTFAKNAPTNIDVPDIEDLTICHKTGKRCNKTCSDNNDDKDKHNEACSNNSDDEDWCVVKQNDCMEVSITRKSVLLKDGRKWFAVENVTDVFRIFQGEGIDSYMLVAGNTAKGAYPILEYPKILIDISGVKELKTYLLDQNLIIGSGVTLTELLNIYKGISNKSNFGYLKEFYNHLELVAHIAVRNLGTIGGNLMIKYQHNEFQSDLYLMFVTVGAELTILNRQLQQVNVSMEQFLRIDMRGAIILNVKLPPLSDVTKVKTLKVMPRSQNAHAIVNFGALYKFSINGSRLVECRLAFGGLSAAFTRATATEKFLVGKPLFRNETLQGAVRLLENELVVTEIPPEPSARYRKKLAVGLFYKSLLSLCPANILHQRFRSGIIKLRDSRPVSTAKQSYETKPSLWPLTQPIPKIEGLIQCAGEAFYTEDMPAFPNEVFADLVLSTVSKGTITSIDSKKAMSYPGVIAVYTAKDIPGLNSFTPADAPRYSTNEEIFCSSEIKYYNQPVAVVVAESRHIAELAAKMVTINYKKISKPVINVKVAKTDPNRVKFLKSIPATSKGTDVVKVIKGSNTIYGQYFFTIETLASVVRPTEEGIEVYVTTQWTDAVQTMISRALKIDGSRIDVHVRRLGGAYGIKISRSILIAIAASLVSTKLNRPCRIIQSMQNVARAFGKRFSCSSDYEFGVNKSGVIQYANHMVYEDNGYNINEQLANFGLYIYYNCYDKSRWNFNIFNVITDTAKNTWFRAPGSLENMAMAEIIMEHISYELSLDPVQLRLANLDPKYNSIRDMLNVLITESQYVERRAEVNKFNAENRWKKRGLRFVPLKWNHPDPRVFDVNLSVYHFDGTVTIVHGGVEIGQGINTRITQIAAHILGIPLDKIQIKANNTIICPNAGVTGGSVTHQFVGLGVERSCKKLLENLEPTKSKMNNPSWQELIAQAYIDGVDLQAHGFVSPQDNPNSDVYGVTFAEVEIDVLTGEMEVLRVDIMEDVGQSLSPEIDLGQVEGAFVMGQGYWTTEQLVYDQNTGELLTDRPWNYYVPLARDIPRDFRVYLRKNSFGDRIVLGSKVIGEPPICMAVAIPFAIREAVTAARADSGIPSTTWFPFDGPSTSETICLGASTNSTEYAFY